MELNLSSIIVGWPAIIASLFISYFGIVIRNYILLILGAIFATPFSLYLSMNPMFQSVAFVFPLFHAGAAVAVYSQKRILAIILLVPFTLLAIWLAYSVLSQ